MLFALSCFTVYWAWWVLARSGLLERPRETLWNRWPPTPVRAVTRARWDPKLGEMVFHARPTGNRPRVSQFAKAVDCPWCAGFYLAGALTLTLDLLVNLPLPALWWIATNTGAALVAQVADALGR